ncbi:BirA family transcriptional regulator, biotin operon repressor / biotin---(acetyl-CoA-carboxylase) ligase [Candidatus Magnetomoraceae bacterium gMMP-15]
MNPIDTWEIPGRETLIHYFDEVSSTMDTARDMAALGHPHGTIIIAGRQSAGHGRLKRLWHSDDGGLYFTMILRPDISLNLCYRINFAASLSIARILNNIFNINTRLKWPNDVLAGGKKISGMLSEISAGTDIINYFNLGIGININNNPSEYEPGAVSIKKILKKSISRKKVLTAFLNEFESKLKNIERESLILEWKKCTCTLNQKVKVITTNKIYKGLAVDVDETGALILKLDDGSLQRIVYGDCFNT